MQLVQVSTPLRAAQKPAEPAQTWARQAHKARLGETSGHERCVATKARCAQPCTSA